MNLPDIPDAAPEQAATAHRSGRKPKHIEEAHRQRVSQTLSADVRAVVPVVERNEEALARAEAARADMLGKLGSASGRLAARKAFLRVPEGLTGNEAESWSDAKLIELLPLAVAEKEYELLYGDDQQRSKAADKVLEATGRGKRDSGGGNAAPIIILTGSGPLPFIQRASGAIIDGKKKE